MRLARAPECRAARPLRLLHLAQLCIDLPGTADSAFCLQQAEVEETLRQKRAKERKRKRKFVGSGPENRHGDRQVV